MIEESHFSIRPRCTCNPPSREQLDRTLCACGHMHFYCECGLRTDDCPFDEVLS